MTGEEDGAVDLAVHLVEVQRLKEGRPLKGVPTRAHISCEVPTPSFHSPQRKDVKAAPTYLASTGRENKKYCRRLPVLLKLAAMPMLPLKD